MTDFSDTVVEKLETHFMFNNFFFFSENCAFYETMWKNVVEPDIACLISKATNIHTGCVVIVEMVARTRFNVTLYLHCLYS
jgi:hypothetical protein